MRNDKDYRAIIENFDFSDKPRRNRIAIIANGSLFITFLAGFFLTGGHLIYGGTITISAVFLVLAGIFLLGLISSK